MAQYPFEAAVKGASPSTYNKKVAKTAGKTGIMRTRERLNWQKKHLAQAEQQMEMAVAAMRRYAKEAKEHDAMLNQLKRKLNSATPAEKEALRKKIANVRTRVANADKSAKIFKKRALKHDAEAAKLRTHIHENTLKLGAKLNARNKKRAAKK